VTAGPVRLAQADAAAAFYAERYESGYMQEWPPQKLARVAAFIQQLRLASTGAFLDFGCGTGVFTELLQRLLPGWQASGAEIVEAALRKARERLPAARFCSLEQLEQDARFDLVFSHHVLEHVQDLQHTVDLLGRLTKPGGTMIAILPCGNPGSLEHRLCNARADGIDPACGDRFFFEDEGHLRRLTSEQLIAVAARSGFTVRAQLFANHYHGALKWLTEQTPDWLKRTIDPRAAADPADKAWFSALRRRVLWLRFLRRPPSLLVPGMEWRLQKPDRSWVETLALVASNPVTIVSGAVERWLQRNDEREWSTRAADTRGSEMFVVFTKDAAPTGT
jgi:trans-aconitate methyltransferase